MDAVSCSKSFLREVGSVDDTTPDRFVISPLHYGLIPNCERWIATCFLSMDDLVPRFHSVWIGTLHHTTSESIFYVTYLHPLSSNLLLAMQIILSVITGAQKHRGFGFLRSCSFSQTCRYCFCTCSYAHNTGAYEFLL
jgi:hypothetical protein